jgi:hypothetical protein
MTWKDLDSWRAAQAADDNIKVMGDLVNFTNATPMILVGTVKD